MNDFSNPKNPEKQFNKFCKERNWKIYKIPELPNIKTPDFFVIANSIPFIVEIKKLYESGSERKDIKKFKGEDGNIEGIHLDYNKEINSIVKKIDEANQQFKTTSSFGVPQILIIYSERFYPLDKEIVMEAMYGKVFPVLSIKTIKNVSKNISKNLPPLIKDRTLRKNKNNLISAVAIQNHKNGMFILHNLWANIPLPTSIFNDKNDRNYLPAEISFEIL